MKCEPDPPKKSGESLRARQESYNCLKSVGAHRSSSKRRIWNSGNDLRSLKRCQLSDSPWQRADGLRRESDYSLALMSVSDEEDGGASDLG